MVTKGAINRRQVCLYGHQTELNEIEPQIVRENPIHLCLYTTRAFCGKEWGTVGRGAVLTQAMECDIQTIKALSPIEAHFICRLLHTRSFYPDPMHPLIELDGPWCAQIKYIGLVMRVQSKSPPSFDNWLYLINNYTTVDKFSCLLFSFLFIFLWSLLSFLFAYFGSFLQRFVLFLRICK